MSDELTPGNGTVPPKLTLRNDTPPTAKKETARLDLSTAQAPPVAAQKKITSRIPLESVSAAPGETGTAAVPGISSKTIRLSPLAAARPINIPPSPRPPAAVSAAEMAKRQTSRIPLDAALAEEQGAGTGTAAAGAPKTIRIKRPNQPPSTVQPAVQPEAAEKSKTARVDVGELAAAEAGQATQRKTIKIRRTEGTPARPVPRSVAVARLEAEAAERIAQQVRIHPAFPVMAALALVVLGLLVVALAAQAYPSLGWKLPGSVTI